VTNPKPRRGSADLWLSLLFLALFALTRLWQLGLFPPFLDEMIHVYWGERILQTGPLAFADEGRLLTTWLMIAFQAQEATGIWLARVAVVLVGMVGFAGALSIGRLLAGRTGLIVTAVLLLCSPYHFFFERLALADTTAGAIALLGVAFSLRLIRREAQRDALFAGISLALAVGLKLTTLVYLVVPVIAVLTLRPKAWRWLLTYVLTAGALVGGFLALLVWRGYNPFALIFTHNSDTSSGRLFQNILSNLSVFAESSAAYWTVPFMILAGGALVYLCWKRRFFLPLGFVIPLAGLLISQRQSARYWFTVETLLLVLLVGAWGQLPMAVQRKAQWPVLAGLGLWLAVVFTPFAWPFYADANAVRLPQGDMMEYVISDASGYGIQAILDQVPADAQSVIGILANCQALRYLAAETVPVTCPRLGTQGQDIDAIAALLEAAQQETGVYVVYEDTPYAPPREALVAEWLATVERPQGQINLHLYALSGPE
jgi:4-amino-4-deoxy-L-arabinose transferase-like glycosyltransferase